MEAEGATNGLDFWVVALPEMTGGVGLQEEPISWHFCRMCHACRHEEDSFHLFFGYLFAKENAFCGHVGDMAASKKGHFKGEDGLNKWGSPWCGDV